MLVMVIQIYDYLNTFVYFSEHLTLSWNFHNEMNIKHLFGISEFAVAVKP
jgi:hypothetical protein